MCRYARFVNSWALTGRLNTSGCGVMMYYPVKVDPLLLQQRKGETGNSSQYGAVYGELYRKFGITSYKLLPANKFEEAMKWLSDWHVQLTDDSPF